MHRLLLPERRGDGGRASSLKATSLMSGVAPSPLQGVPLPSSPPRRFAVLGAGFAGVSVAWHLLQHTCNSGPVCVDLFDEVGIGGGASGVSGGLLHPFTPKGKLLWKGNEGWQAALNLVAVAEKLNATIPNSKPIAWRRGILRPLIAEKHIIQARKLRDSVSFEEGIKCLEASLAQAIVPGLVLPESGLALYMTEGLNLDSQHYLDTLWLACKSFGLGTQAVLKKEKVSSLIELSKEGYEAVVVCTGSKAVLLPELSGKLLLSMCRGVVAQLELPSNYEEYHSQAPNLLSHTWLAIQGARRMVLGATKDWSSGPECADVSVLEETLVRDELVSRAESFYPLIQHWEVTSLRAGVRAMPPRTAVGALPLAGCIDKLVQPLRSETQWWLLGGLGSRGLIYHGWLGELVAAAAISRNPALIPPELNHFTSLLPQV